MADVLIGVYFVKRRKAASSMRSSSPSTVEGDELRMLLAALRRFTKYTPINTSAIRERLADKVVAVGGYIF